MNRQQRIDCYGVLIAALIEKPNPMFGVYWAQMVVTGVAYSGDDNYNYRLTLKILNEMVDDGLLFQYTTTYNESVFVLITSK